MASHEHDDDVPVGRLLAGHTKVVRRYFANSIRSISIVAEDVLRKGT